MWKPWFCHDCKRDVPEEVYIIGPGGRKITLLVCVWSTTVKTMKQLIADNEGIPVSQQRLAYAGRIPPDHRTLSKCGILPHSIVQLFVADAGSILLTLTLCVF